MPINKVDTKSIADNAVVVADFVNATISNDKLVNTSITIGGKSVSLGSSVTTQDVQWQSVQTSSFAATVGYGYFINTTSAAITMTLPASPTAGNYIAFVDYAGTFATNNLTIARNGNPIQSISTNSVLSTNKAAGLLVYVDATVGWTFVEQNNVSYLGPAPTFTSATGGTITTSGNFKIHSFTGDGSFVVSTVGNSPIGVPGAGPSTIDYLVVAGGGGGGGDYGSGGGGAGGYRTTFPSPGCNAGSFTITTTTYPVTVGAGGSGGVANPGVAGTPGSNSVFSTITSAGGGGGSNYPLSTGISGGSGGGGGSTGTPSSPSPFSPLNNAGTGNNPPVSPPQGNPGGSGTAQPNYASTGGGGGAGGAGTPGGNATGGPGGVGSTNSISGSPVTYAGGGGGGVLRACAPYGTAGSGGPGGGGTGSAGSGSSTTGQDNTGGGGGSGSRNVPGGNLTYAGSAGGKGIVVIRYKYQ